MGRFSAAFFDLDGTLWDNVGCADAVMEIVLPKLMPHLPEEDPAEVLVRFNAALLGLVRNSGITLAAQFSPVDRFERLLDSYDIQDRALAREMSTVYNTARRFLMRSFVRKHARMMLERLRAEGIVLGVITNGTPAIQRNVLQALGLEDYMDHVVIGEVEGYKKPDRRLFERALELAHLEPQQVLYVGDSRITDVLGASRAGIPVALLNPSDAPCPPCPGADGERTSSLPAPDFEITDLSQVLSIVHGTH